MVTVCVCSLAFVVTIMAIWNVEGADDETRSSAVMKGSEKSEKFSAALGQVWAEPKARRFAIFVFVSMLAYGAQDLILDPFAGSVFGLTPGGSTKLSGIQHGGVLVGMILVALATCAVRRSRAPSLQTLAIGGCLASAVGLFSLAFGGFVGPSWPLRTSVFLLGVANGTYAIAAIGSMMALVNEGRKSREGMRMGLWGAAQAVAFGLGGFAGTVASDVARYVFGAPNLAYAFVFIVEATLFLVSAVLAFRVDQRVADRAEPPEREMLGADLARGEGIYGNL
jgi:BCD family chlorophyll transporter-like MFS transporter